MNGELVALKRMTWTSASTASAGESSSSSSRKNHRTARAATARATVRFPENETAADTTAKGGVKITIVSDSYVGMEWSVPGVVEVPEEAAPAASSTVTVEPSQPEKQTA